MSTAANRVEWLRQAELECYRICFYLLQNEREAVQATGHVLMELYQDNGFWHDDDRKKRETMRSRSMKWSVTVKRKNA